MQTTSQDALITAAAQDSLPLAYASAWLGSPGCRPSAALLRELLASAASHKAVSVQAAAAQLAPAVLAAAANASAAGLSQVVVQLQYLHKHSSSAALLRRCASSIVVV